MVSIASKIPAGAVKPGALFWALRFAYKPPHSLLEKLIRWFVGSFIWIHYA